MLPKTGLHKFSKKSGSHMKILGARSQTWNKFHTDDPQLFCATVQNVVTWMTWHLGFLQCCPKYLSGKC